MRIKSLLLISKYTRIPGELLTKNKSTRSVRVRLARVVMSTGSAELSSPGGWADDPEL